MPYDSPKQIRNRQNQRNNAWGAARRRSAQPHTITIVTDEEWERRRDAHIERIHECDAAGQCDAAGRHAQYIVHETTHRRALEIMRDFGRAYWKAMAMARHELYNCES